MAPHKSQSEHFCWEPCQPRRHRPLEVAATILVASARLGEARRESAMIDGIVVGIVVALLGLGLIVLGSLQLSRAVPILRRTGTFSACMNVAAGIFLIALGVLRFEGLL